MRLGGKFWGDSFADIARDSLLSIRRTRFVALDSLILRSRSYESYIRLLLRRDSAWVGLSHGGRPTGFNGGTAPSV